MSRRAARCVQPNGQTGFLGTRQYLINAWRHCLVPTDPAAGPAHDTLVGQLKARLVLAHTWPTMAMKAKRTLIGLRALTMQQPYVRARLLAPCAGFVFNFDKVCVASDGAQYEYGRRKIIYHLELLPG